MPGSVVSVNISPVRTVLNDGKKLRTAIGKIAVDHRVGVDDLSLVGDEQADHRYHGGPDRAVYAYAAEDYAWWSEQLGRTIPPGRFGENLTLHGIDVSNARIGERWRIGSAILQVTSPRTPCAKLNYVMDDPTFVKAFAKAMRPGAYLRVIEAGDVGAGDDAEVLSRPAHDLSLVTMAEIFLFDRSRVAEALAVPELPDFLREWALDHQR
jgi:MOSC domain-containing protein YiiM